MAYSTVAGRSGRRGFGGAAAVALAAGVCCGSAWGAEPPLLVHLPGESGFPTDQPRATVREVVVVVDAGALPAPEVARGRKIALDLFPDLRLEGVIDRVERGGTGTDIYRGRIEGRGNGTFTLVRGEGVLIGDVRLGLAGLFEIRALPVEAGGTHVVRQIDESALPPCATGPEHVVNAPDGEAPGGEGGLRGGAPGDDGSVVDVLVVYTAQARDAAGGRAGMDALIDLAMNTTNQAYVNSGIPTSVNLVYRGVIDYAESGNASTDLNRFRGTTDGFMDDVHCLRNAHGADLNALIVSSFNACGIGYLMGNVSTGFASNGFSVSARGCISGLTFAHELGHNQGSHHDRGNAGSTPAFPYSYGWRTPGNQFRTVMAYSPGTRIPYFSTPDVTYQGFVLGNPAGSADAADNARSIEETSSTVASFRASRGEMNPLERVSNSSGGIQGNGASGLEGVAVSGDGGVVAFTSLASNLDAGDGNGAVDVYVYDFTTGRTTRESVASGGTPGIGGGVAPSIMNDGRRLVFASDATDLVSGDTQGHRDVFLRDRVTGITARVSLGAGNVAANGPSDHPVIAGDVMVVAFESDATNLVVGDGNGATDIFLRNIQASSTVRVSRGTGGAGGGDADGPSWGAQLSADGRFVAFESEATNLVSGDGNGVRDVFVHDRQTLQTTRVSLSGLGAEANGASSNARLSADGRYIAFESDATNLVSGDTNGARDVFVHDRIAGTTRRVSVTETGGQIGGTSSLQDLSADGRSVLFISSAAGIVAGDTNGGADLFLRDTSTRATRRVSMTWLGQQANGASLAGALSGDGRYAVLSTGATNLAPCDGNGTAADVVRLDLGEPTTALCPADTDGDGSINSGDISAFLTLWLASVGGEHLEADFTGDGQANSGDISAYLTAWLAAVNGGC